MDYEKRTAVYMAQNGSTSRLTGPQRRRLVHKLNAATDEAREARAATSADRARLAKQRAAIRNGRLPA